MANKKNKKKAQQQAPANNAAANSKVEAKKAVAKKNEKSCEVQEEREAWFLRPHQEVFCFGEVRDEACHVAR